MKVGLYYVVIVIIIFPFSSCTDPIGIRNFEEVGEKNFSIFLPSTGNFEFTQTFGTTIKPARVKTNLTVTSSEKDTLKIEVLAFQNEIPNYEELVWVYSGTIITNTNILTIDSLSNTLLDKSNLHIAVFSNTDGDSKISGHFYGSLSVITSDQNDKIIPLYGNLDRGGRLLLLPVKEKTDFQYLSGIYNAENQFSGFTIKNSDSVSYSNTKTTFNYDESSALLKDTLSNSDASKKLILSLSKSN